jgi:5-(carboxyamino)imidazole ribonucleotide mutase
MPAGVPVATVSIGNAFNAGLLAARVLAASDSSLQQAMLAFQEKLAETARTKGQVVKNAVRDAAQREDHA